MSLEGWFAETLERLDEDDRRACLRQAELERRWCRELTGAEWAKLKSGPRLLGCVTARWLLLTYHRR